jgi:hypothetical protein
VPVEIEVGQFVRDTPPSVAIPPIVNVLFNVTFACPFVR